MKIYFLSSQPCALMVNGAYFGRTDRFERFAELALRDGVYLNFMPENAQPLGFFLTEQIRFQPPDGVEVYLLQDGVAVYARDFPPNDFLLKTIAQARFDNLLCTLFVQGTPQISVQSPDGFFNAPLPHAFKENACISMHADLLFIHTNTHLAVYTRKAERLFFEEIHSFEVKENQLVATLPLSDLFARTAECVYNLSPTSCARVSFTLRQNRTLQGETDERKIAEELLAYAFFESVLIGGDYTAFLSDELLSKAENLREFLGDFISVTLTGNPNVCGLIKQKAERLFEVHYVTVEQKKGKITDIKG